MSVENFPEPWQKKLADLATAHRIEIEELTVTENGTYSEEGKAYSPVTVNVPSTPTEYNVYTYQDEEEPITSIVYAAQYDSLTMQWSKAEETPIDTASAGSMLFIDVSDKSSLDSIAYKISDEVFAPIYPTDQDTEDSSYTFFMPAGDVYVFLIPTIG